MTRADWIAIAAVLYEARRVANENERAIVEVITKRMAQMLRKRSSRFDSRRFLQLAGAGS